MASLNRIRHSIGSQWSCLRRLFEDSQLLKSSLAFVYLVKFTLLVILLYCKLLNLTQLINSRDCCVVLMLLPADILSIL